MDRVPDGSFGRAAVAAAAVTIVLIGLHLLSGLVGFLALSALVAILLVPLQGRLQRGGVPGWLALSACIAAYLAVVAAAIGLVGLGLIQLARELPAYAADLQGWLDELRDVLAGIGIESGDPVDTGTIVEVARGAISTVANLLVGVGLSVFLVAYLLLDARTMRRRLLGAFAGADRGVEAGAELVGRLRSYLYARIVLGGIAAILDLLLLVVLGVPFALLWGVLSFILSFIPNLGFILALVPPAILGLAVGGWPVGIAVVVGYSVINVAIDYVIQPRYIGSSVDLGATVVFVSLLFWGAVLGAPGALLAVPLTLVAAAILAAFPETAGLARMLGTEDDGRPPEAAVPALEGGGAQSDG
jgi:AI-2 transport protein TqsA